MVGSTLGSWQACNLAPFLSQRPHPIMQCWGAALAHAPCMTRPLPALGETLPCFCSVGKKRKGQGGPLGAQPDSGPACSTVDGRKAFRWRHVHACGHRWQRVTTGLCSTIICPKQMPVCRQWLPMHRQGSIPTPVTDASMPVGGDTAPRLPLSPGLGALGAAASSAPAERGFNSRCLRHTSPPPL